jgi:hypothetical protein
MIRKIKRNMMRNEMMKYADYVAYGFTINDAWRLYKPLRKIENSNKRKRHFNNALLTAALEKIKKKKEDAK